MEVVSIVQNWIDQVGNDEKVIRLLEEKRVPCGPVLTVDEVVENKSYRERGTIRKIVDPKLGAFYFQVCLSDSRILSIINHLRHLVLEKIIKLC